MGGVKGKQNLFVAASRNADALERKLAVLLSEAPPEHLDSLKSYSDIVKCHGRISVNMLQTTITSFLSMGQHWNMYEWVRSVATLSPKTAEEILRERLGTFYDQRTAFDSHFDGGETFRYGALNIGGLGSWCYGEYCIVLNEEVSRRPEVAYLRSDSLKSYVLPSLTVDEDSIGQETAPDTHRHCLAVLKHADTIPSRERQWWPTLLCSNVDYVEAIFTGSLTPDEVEEVRMSKVDYEIRFYFAFESFREKLSDHDKFLVSEFRTTLLHLRERSIPIKAV